MAIVRRGIYGADGRRRSEADTWFVFTAFADVAEHHVIVKIGISTKPYEKLVDVHTNSPFGVDLAAFAVVGSKRRALACERQILDAFAEFKTRREWLLLPRDQAVKARFAETAKLALRSQVGADFTWRRISRYQIEASISGGA